MTGFPHSSVDKESACNAGDPGSIPESGRSPGEGNDSPLQYPSPENLMDTGACLYAGEGTHWVSRDNGGLEDGLLYMENVGHMFLCSSLLVLPSLHSTP